MLFATKVQTWFGRAATARQRGYSMPDLVVVVGAAGLFLGPVLVAVEQWSDKTRAELTEMTLITARNALIGFATEHNGCLPFAADFEGGLPDTDEYGAPGHTDTGLGRTGVHAGDLPWAELGLLANFRDADGLRIQYYVASYFTDNDPSDAEITCDAELRGDEWDPRVAYQGTTNDPVYVYYTPQSDSRGLFEIDGLLASGTPPSTAFTDVAEALPDALLELRRGPDVTGPDEQSDVISAQNVFVLIAPGRNRNAAAVVDRLFMRDANHVANDLGDPWAPNVAAVDGVRFAATTAIDVDAQEQSGDDHILAMSFTRYRAALVENGVNVEPVVYCAGGC